MTRFVKITSMREFPNNVAQYLVTQSTLNKQSFIQSMLDYDTLKRRSAYYRTYTISSQKQNIFFSSSSVR